MTKAEMLEAAYAVAQKSIEKQSEEQGVAKEIIDAQAVINRQSIKNNIDTYLTLFNKAGLLEFDLK